MYTDLKFEYVIDLVVWMNDGLLIAQWTNAATLIRHVILYF